MVKKTPEMANWEEIIYSFLDARWLASKCFFPNFFLGKVTTFNWEVKDHLFTEMGLQDACWYVCSEAYLKKYGGTTIPKKPSDTTDGRITHQTRITAWCKRKAKDLKMSEDFWMVIRQQLWLRARTPIEVRGRLSYYADPKNSNKILKNIVFLLYCEKDDSGKKVVKEMLKRGYKCRMVLSQGMAKADEMLLAAEIEILKQAGESFQVIHVHDQDVGGYRIMGNLMKYVPTIINGGLSEEFWKYHAGAFEFDDYAQSYIANKTHRKALRNKGFKLTKILPILDKRVELPVFILREGASPIVDFIEHKLKGLDFNLYRIDVEYCKEPEEEPIKITNLKSDIESVCSEIHPVTKKERRYGTSKYDIQDIIEKEETRIREEAEEAIDEMKKKMDPLKQYYRSKELLLWNIRYTKSQDLYQFWLDENQVDDQNWDKDAQICKEVFRAYHEHFRGNILIPEEYIEKQDNFLDFLVNEGYWNRSLIEEMCQEGENFMELIKTFFNLEIIGKWINKNAIQR